MFAVSFATVSSDGGLTSVLGFAADLRDSSSMLHVRTIQHATTEECRVAAE